jgi:hypothetical protein
MIAKLFRQTRGGDFEAERFLKASGYHLMIAEAFSFQISMALCAIHL